MTPQEFKQQRENNIKKQEDDGGLGLYNDHGIDFGIIQVNKPPKVLHENTFSDFASIPKRILS